MVFDTTGPGTFFRNGASESVTYTNSQTVSLTSGFILGGVNTLVAYINNTDTADPNAPPSNFQFDAAATALTLGGAVTFDVPTSGAPEPGVLLLTAAGLAAMLFRRLRANERRSGLARPTSRRRIRTPVRGRAGRMRGGIPARLRWTPASRACPRRLEAEGTPARRRFRRERWRPAGEGRRRQSPSPAKGPSGIGRPDTGRGDRACGRERWGRRGAAWRGGASSGDRRRWDTIQARAGIG